MPQSCISFIISRTFHNYSPYDTSSCHISPRITNITAYQRIASLIGANSSLALNYLWFITPLNADEYTHNLLPPHQQYRPTTKATHLGFHTMQHEFLFDSFLNTTRKLGSAYFLRRLFLFVALYQIFYSPEPEMIIHLEAQSKFSIDTSCFSSIFHFHIFLKVASSP